MPFKCNGSSLFDDNDEADTDGASLFGFKLFIVILFLFCLFVSFNIKQFSLFLKKT